MKTAIVSMMQSQPPASADHRSRLGGRAFTLIEMMAVIVLLGIAATLVIPRIMSNERRVAQARMRELSSLLSVVAQRNAITNERLALQYTRQSGVIELLALRTRGDETRWAKAEWARDPLVPPVKLESLELTEAVFDGTRAESRGWRLDLSPGQVRPSIELVLRTPRGTRPEGSWHVELLPYAGAASVTELGASGGAGARSSLRSVDLDAQGRGDSPW